MFEIAGKVALVTGGTAGIGLEIAKALLENGLRAVVVVGRNETNGKSAEEVLNKQCGENKAVFIKADVCDKQQLIDAFESTVQLFNNLDIVINNAGAIFGKNWELEVQTNLVGVATGTILAAETYLPKYKSGDEAVILNMSSILGLDGCPGLPVYSATKSAIIGLSRSFGSKNYYEKTNVRVMVLCPGYTYTEMIQPQIDRFLGQFYMDTAVLGCIKTNIQKSTTVSDIAVQMIKNGETGSVWVSEDCQPPYEIDSLFEQRLKK